MFTTTRASTFLDYWRVPYDHRGDRSADVPSLQVVRTDRPGSGLLAWPVREPDPGAVALPGPLLLSGVSVPQVLLDDDAALAAAGDLPGRWSPAEPLTDRRGAVRAHVWRSAEGGCLLPFDPDAVVTDLWAERREGGAGSPLRQVAQQAYYAVRPLLPRPVRLALRRCYAPLQARSDRQPLAEPGLHPLYRWLGGALRALAGAPVPHLSPWPDGHDWALVLTHDVETGQGVEQIDALREPERDRGLTSSWNIVPERYPTPGPVLEDLVEQGCEVGVHGLRHDGRDLAPEHLLERLPRVRAFADRWGAVGFRSPSTLRDAAVMPQLGFAYDSSFPAWDPYEPQPGGCSTWLPYSLDGLVEVPITMTQDHTMMLVLGRRDADLWTDEARRIRDDGGMVLMLTHPDYVPDGPLVEAYAAFLDQVCDWPGAWRALPRDVADWWHERARTQVVHEGGEWRAAGPGAARARVATW